MYPYAIYNGDMRSAESINVHISDLGLQRGYGVFDYFTMVRGRIPWVEDYLERFFRSMDLGGMSISYSGEDIIQMVKQLAQKNKQDTGGFKLVCTGGLSTDAYRASGDCTFFIMHMPLFMKRTPRTDEGRTMIVADYLRPLPEIKSLFYFHSVLMQKRMRQYDAIDILYQHNDIVYEASRSNVFIVQGRTIYTKKDEVLRGITRQQVIKIAENGYDFAYRDFSMNELLGAEEVFITSSAKGVMPIVHIEDHRIADGKPGPVTQSLKYDLYQLYVG